MTSILKTIADPLDKKGIIAPKISMYELFWKSIFIVLIITTAFLFQKNQIFHNASDLQHVKKHQNSDFLLAIYVAIFIALIRHIISYLMIDIAYDMLKDQRKKDEQEGRKRAQQICKWIFDVPYYLTTTITNIILIKDQDFYPKYLGGTGDCVDLFPEWPQQKEIPYLRVLYVAQTGNHIYSLIHQLFFKKSDPKYYEFVLHHSVTLVLIYFSYMTNMMVIGVIVMLLHDPGDMMLCFSRGYVDYKYGKTIMKIICATLTYIIWVFTRNIVFPRCCITAGVNQFMKLQSIEQESLNQQQYMVFFLTCNMAVLALMHLYWTFFLTKGALGMITKHQDKNGYDS